MKWFRLLLCLWVPLAAATLPVSFEPNQGQADTRVRFLARLPGFTLYVTASEAVFAAGPGSSGEPAVQHMRWIGANPAPRIEPLDKLPGISNYYIGNDSSKWRSNIPTYARFALRQVYPGIDLIFYTKPGQLEYDWIVAPGADPKQIRVRWDSPEQISETSGGDLILSDWLRQNKPAISQQGKAIAGSYSLHGTDVAFDIPRYDRTQPLRIDPVLLYSTYLGGTTVDPALPTQGDFATAIALDGSGNMYVAGYTASINFPTSKPIKPSYGGGTDAFVAKLNSTGSTLIYSTYLGGLGYDNAYSIGVDSLGDAYVTGGTSSVNFPTVNPLQASFRGSLNGNANPSNGRVTIGNAFVTKLNPNGSALLYSTYLGGSGADFGLGLAVDSTGNSYITGSTSSPDFPTANPIQQKLASIGGSNAFVAKINPSGSALTYSTYLGGRATDVAAWIAIDSGGNAYITGATTSANFPLVNPIQSAIGNNSQSDTGFVAKINAAGSAVVYSTYLGGSGEDLPQSIAVDSAGNAYVGGNTTSSNFPVANALQPRLLSLSGSNGFVTKINAAGSALVYSTYLGGSNSDTVNTVSVDSSGNAYAAGGTGSGDFPVRNGIQTHLAGQYDAFAAEINPSGSTLVYSTYLGGSGGDTVFRSAINASGDLYLAGGSTSSDYPLSSALQNTSGHPGVFTGVISVIAPFSALPAALSISGGNAQNAVVSTTLPQPLAVTVTSSSGAAVSGAIVAFSVTSGSAILSAATVQTDSTGTASVNLTFGAVPGAVNVSASLAGFTITPVTFNETATASSTCPIGPPQITSVNFATDFGGFSNFSSGSYLEVKGANLAIDSRQWATADFQGSNAPTMLDGSSVTIDGRNAFVSYISAQQINVQAPTDPVGGMVPVVVVNCGGSSKAFVAMKNTITPGILAPASFNIGKQYAVALFASDLAQGAVTYAGNTGLIAGANFRPAKPNDVVVLYGLGFGPVAPATPPGVIAAGSTNLAGLSVSFGSTPAAVGYAGLYPGYVGLYEFYVTVPSVSDGDSQLNISVNGTPVPQTLFLTVHQ